MAPGRSRPASSRPPATPEVGVDLLLAGPELSGDSFTRLASLRDRTPSVRRSLAQGADALESARASVEAALADAADQDEVTAILLAILEDVQRATSRLSKRMNQTVRGLRARPDELVVAFFGRTMAGKSTLVETLTGGSGDAIGIGAQRTTRESRYCPWGDVVLLDTPGIGAFKGERDGRIARRDVRDADLVVFVLTDDSIQEESFQGLEYVREENKPVIFVLNVKLDMTQRVLRSMFRRDPTRFLGREAVRGHLDRLEELARDRLGLTDYQVLTVHAQAAWLGLEELDSDLLAASGASDLVAAVTETVTRTAVPLRIRSTFDPSILELERAAATVAALASRVRTHRDSYEHRAEVLDQRIVAILRTHRRRVDATVRDHVGRRRAELRGWFEEHIDDEAMEKKFQRWLAPGRLRTLLEADLRQAAGELEEACEETFLAVQADLSVSIGDHEELQPFDMRDWRTALARLATTIKVVTATLKVAKLIRSGGGAAGLALVALTELLRWLARHVPSLRVMRNQYIAQATRRTDAVLRELMADAAREAKRPIAAEVEGGLARQLVDSLEQSAALLSEVTNDFGETVVSLHEAAATLGGSLFGELLNGEPVDLWGRVPGSLAATRHGLQRAAVDRLEMVLGETVLPLETTATAAISQLFEGGAVSWKRDLVRVSAEERPVDVKARLNLAARIAGRPVELRDR